MRIPWTQDQLDVIHQGMYRVVHGTNSWGTAHSLKNVKPSISGKTGTAQTTFGAFKDNMFCHVFHHLLIQLTVKLYHVFRTFTHGEQPTH